MSATATGSASSKVALLGPVPAGGGREALGGWLAGPEEGARAMIDAGREGLQNEDDLDRYPGECRLSCFGF